jgi:hypothetical protein
MFYHAGLGKSQALWAAARGSSTSSGSQVVDIKNGSVRRDFDANLAVAIRRGEVWELE